MIEEGTYRARADKSAASFGESKNHNEQVSVPFTILADGPSRGSTIIFIGAFAPGQATDITCDALEAAGWDGANLATLDGLGSVDVDLVIVHETYEGKKRAKIRFVNRLGGGFKFNKSLDAARVGSLAERVSRQRRGAAGAAPASGGGVWDGTGPDPAGGFSNDDDPPF